VRHTLISSNKRVGVTENIPSIPLRDIKYTIFKIKLLFLDFLSSALLTFSYSKWVIYYLFIVSGQWWSCLYQLLNAINFCIVLSYSFQYIFNLCNTPATTPQKVISAKMTYKRVPTLSECQTLTNTCFLIQCTWFIFSCTKLKHFRKIYTLKLWYN